MAQKLVQFLPLSDTSEFQTLADQILNDIGIRMSQCNSSKEGVDRMIDMEEVYECSLNVEIGDAYENMTFDEWLEYEREGIRSSSDDEDYQSYIMELSMESVGDDLPWWPGRMEGARFCFIGTDSPVADAHGCYINCVPFVVNSPQVSFYRVSSSGYACIGEVHDPIDELMEVQLDNCFTGADAPEYYCVAM